MNASVRRAMWLVKAGIPFDVAFSLDDTTAYALSVVASEQANGRVFNWHTEQYEDPPQ